MHPLLSRIFGLGKPATRAYDAAGGGRRWQGFTDMPNQVAAQLAARGPAGKRARALVANNPLAASGVEVWVSALVGTGLKPQSTHPDPNTRAVLNAAFERWTDIADADGRGDFYSMQALATRRMVIDGEAFGALSHDDVGTLKVRLLDAEQVDPSLHRDMGQGGRIVAGVEVSAAGKRTGFHVYRERPGLPLGTSLDTLRVPADDMCHLFRSDVPGQVRGLSWFAPVMLRLADFDSAVEAHVVRQRNAACLTGFVITPDGEAGMPGQTDAQGRLVTSFEPGMVMSLRPGQDIRISPPADMGAESIGFLKMTEGQIAVGLGVPYEALTGDLSGTNYSSIRAGLVEFRRRVEALQHNVLVFQFCRPVWRRFVTAEVLSGRLAAPDFERDPEPYLGARWITPRQEWVDPKKDAEAEVAAIDAGLISRRQAVASRGMDIEALDAEIAADNQRAAALGLSFTAGTPSKAAPIHEDEETEGAAV